jgi:acyl-CoA synthetase (AMP-forming)/AMP-acid ligase II
MNIAFRLSEMTKLNPDKIALIYKNNHLTFRELDTRSHQFANQLLSLGFKAGDRTLFFLKPSLEFAPMAFALFRIGVIPVFIDPGMGKKNLLKCIKESSAVGLIAEKEIHFLKYFYPKTFHSIKLSVTTGRNILRKKNTKSISQMKKERILLSKTIDHHPQNVAAILFTSGGTGTPKGVVYTHQIFMEQTAQLQKMFQLTPNDIDLPGFPLFSLFTIAMGMQSCIPDMDPRKPAECDPKKLVKNILQYSPTFIAGSPAIWERVADYCLAHKIILPSVKYVVMFGAPVSVFLHEKFYNILPNGSTYTPYGATEALPISNISGRFILENTAHLSRNGHGTCVGLPVAAMQVKIIQSTDKIIEQLSDCKILSTNEIGEIIVQGQMVTKEYMNLPEQTKEAKIHDGLESFWHRMGDVGFLDEQGLLWFCGRKSHCVETEKGTLYPIQCEAIFNQHPDVKRSALVGIGLEKNKVPAIVIERKDGQFLQGKSRSIFESELLAMGKKNSHTFNINKIYFSKSFPVDVRHNIKIDRLKLKAEIESYES